MNTQQLPIIRLRKGLITSTDDLLAVEEPLEIRLQYVDAMKGPANRSLSITMRTPGHDEELALGFLYSEGLIHSKDEIAATAQVNDNVFRVTLQDSVKLDLSRLERHFYTTSSCGICGKASLEALSTEGAEVIRDNQFSPPRSALLALPGKLREHQPLFAQTGGNHGVALFDRQGSIVTAREDVGRHNAMDKLIGWCLQQGMLPLREYGVLVSGRASFELMQKALMAGTPMLAAVGAPSSLAVELAAEFNLRLLGFLSDSGCNSYHGDLPD